MNGKLHEDLGEVTISESVLATIAGLAAVECFGIVGMAAVGMRDGIVHMLKRDKLQKGIEVSVENNAVSLTLHIIVAYGVSICAVTENLIETLTYKLHEYSGMKIKNIDIYVEGVRPID